MSLPVDPSRLPAAMPANAVARAPTVLRRRPRNRRNPRKGLDAPKPSYPRHCSGTPRARTPTDLRTLVAVEAVNCFASNDGTFHSVTVAMLHSGGGRAADVAVFRRGARQQQEGKVGVAENVVEAAPRHGFRHDDVGGPNPRLHAC